MSRMNKVMIRQINFVETVALQQKQIANLVDALKLKTLVAHAEKDCQMVQDCQIVMTVEIFKTSTNLQTSQNVQDKARILF